MSAAPRPGQVHVDVRLRGGLWRRRHLRVDSESLSWGGKTVAFERVTALTYWVTRVTPQLGVPVKALAAQTCEIRLWCGKKRTHIAFRARSEAALHVYDLTVAALHTYVEPRILYELLAAVDSGEVVKVGHLRFSREGLAEGRSPHVPWASIVAIRPPERIHPKVPMGDLFVWARDGEHMAKRVAEIFTTRPNGVLLPHLIQACVSRYAGNG